MAGTSVYDIVVFELRWIKDLILDRVQPWRRSAALHDDGNIPDMYCGYECAQIRFSYHVLWTSTIPEGAWNSDIMI